MSAVVIGRERQVLDSVLAVLHDDGYQVHGTTSEAEALAWLSTSDVTTLIIGGGIEQASRDRLRQAATAEHLPVVESAFAGRTVETYVRDDLESQLR